MADSILTRFIPQNSVIGDTTDMFARLDRSKLINEKEAAEILKLRPVTLRKWRVHGKGPTFVSLGRDIRYRLPDVEAFIEAHLNGGAQ